MKFPTLLEALKKERSTWTINDTVTPEDLFSAWNYSVSALINFYSQSLALWMFVPCGEDGKPLKKPYEGMFEVKGGTPKTAACTLLNPCEAAVDGARYYHKGKYNAAAKAYQAAEQRVLFEGWGVEVFEADEHGFWADLIHETTNASLHLRSGGSCEINRIPMSSATIYKLSSVASHCLTPTQSSINQLNLK